MCEPEVRTSKDVIYSIWRVISKYPNPNSYITVGGDSVYTTYPSTKEFLEVLRLAEVGRKFEALVKAAT